MSPYKGIKKVCRLCLQTFNSLTFVRSANYSATTVEVESVESAAAFKESPATGAASSTTVASTDAESDAFSELAALLPQDAKDTAANATNKNTNFFIFFCF